MSVTASDIPASPLSSDELYLVDSHCHLDRLHQGGLSEQEMDDIVAAARYNGVKRMLTLPTTLDDMPAVVALARRHPEIVYALGVHPLTPLETEPSLDELRALIERYEPVAIGEIGLDYCTNEQGDYRIAPDIQRERLVRHLVAATEARLPVCIHTREAREDTLALLKAHTDPDVGGVLHCFTGDLEMAREAVRMGFMISMSGIVTFHSAENVRELARAIPLDRLLIETDSPYLAPVPFRGKMNQPAYVLEVARCIADVRGISVDEVIMQTTANFHRLFNRVSAA